MKTALREIAAIQTGYSFRTRPELTQPGEVAVIQMKNLADNQVDCTRLLRIRINKLREHHVVRPGDLIFRSRGQATTSAILKDDPGEAIVAAPLLVIRANRKVVLPEFLNWFINQPPAQSFLSTRSEGTAQKMIGKPELECLEVCVPSLDRQRAIVELSNLVEEEQRLMAKLKEKRRQYISMTLLQLTQGELA